MAVTLDQAVQLEQLATEVEAAPAPSTTLDSKLLKLIRPVALATQGISLPSTAAKYTSTIDTALKLRPNGFKGAGQEIWGTQKFLAVASFEQKGEKPGDIIGGAGSTGMTLPLAITAAEARCWAIIVRSYVKTH
jgi:hypothetical protein